MFEDMGDYGQTMSSEAFGGLGKPDVKYVIEESYQHVLKKKNWTIKLCSRETLKIPFMSYTHTFIYDSEIPTLG